MPIRMSAFATLLAAAAVAAGCGGSGDEQTTAAGGAASTGGGAYGRSATGGGAADSGEREEVKLADSPKLGRYLADEEDMALYLFEKDGGTKSTCYGACAEAWPPVLTDGAPKADDGVDAAKLSTTKRRNGGTQVVYNGHPLYYFAPDQAGTTKGQGVDGFGAEWYVLSAAGDAIEDE